MTVRAIHGDSREVLKTLADNSIDAVVTDPPYALVSIVKRFGKPGSAPAKGNDAYVRASQGFMSQTWDTGETAFDPDFWREVYRVLKPGAHVVAASGTRTYHRLACAVEDAGFEIRDMVSWLYGSGFPKSHDVSKGIDKALGRERAKVRVAAPKNPPNLVGGVHNGSDRPWRTEAADRGFHEAVSDEAVSWQGWGTALKPACEPWVLARKPLSGTVAANVLAHGTGALNIDGCRVGLREKPKVTDPKRTSNTYGEIDSPGGKLLPDARWPANVVTDGSDEVVAAFPSAPGQQRPVTGDERAHCTSNAYGDFGRTDGGFEPRGDVGSASRFFYTAKADSADRLGSKHPTVKPISLMRWLCRLVTPPGGLILDPFAGTGTTGLAAMGEGFDAILIEREAEYFADIERRLAWARGEGRLTAQEMARPSATPKADATPSLFGDAA